MVAKVGVVEAMVVAGARRVLELRQLFRDANRRDGESIG